MVDPSKRRTGKNAPAVTYQDLTSSITGEPHCFELPLPIPSEKKQPYSEESAGAYLVDRPQNVEAVIGKTVYMNCRTSDRYTVNWEHTPIGSGTTNDVFISSVLVQPYASRLQMRMNKTSGSYNLIFPSVTREDSGTYGCIDGAGHGERREAELIVLAAPPTCESQINPDGVIGENDCGIEPEHVQFKCHVSFSGNIAPVLKWRVTEGNVVSPKTVTVEKLHDQITVTAVIIPDFEADSHSYSCELTLSNYSCTSDEVRVLYVLRNSSLLKIQDKRTVICVANTSQVCSYWWTKVTDDGTEIVSRNQSYLTDSSGQFKCFAECHLRGRNCTIQAALVELNIDDKVGDAISLNIIYISFLSILLLSNIFLLVLLLSRRYCQPKETPKNMGRSPPAGEACQSTRIPESCSSSDEIRTTTYISSSESLLA